MFLTSKFCDISVPSGCKTNIDNVTISHLDPNPNSFSKPMFRFRKILKRIRILGSVGISTLRAGSFSSYSDEVKWYRTRIPYFVLYFLPLVWLFMRIRNSADINNDRDKRAQVTTYRYQGASRNIKLKEQGSGSRSGSVTVYNGSGSAKPVSSGSGTVVIKWAFFSAQNRGTYSIFLFFLFMQAALEFLSRLFFETSDTGSS